MQQNITRKYTSEAGPIQTKRTLKALQAFVTHASQQLEITGTHGKPETQRTTAYTELFSGKGMSESGKQIYDEIAQEFDWTITAKNYRDIIARLEERTPEVERPTTDKRITPEEEEQQTRNREAAARKAEELQKREDETAAALLAKKPAGACAIVFAEYDEDESDSMTDYFHHRTTRRVAIGWRTGKREDFRQLRRAAATFPETAHLGPEAPASIEHRDNYSMGSGNYLKDGHNHGTGWRVKSYDVTGSGTWWARYGSEIEDQLPDTPPVSASTTVTASTYTIQKHHHTKKGFDFYLVVLADRVDRSAFEDIRDSCKRAGGWYSRKWGSTPGGFAFKHEADAAAWATKEFGGTTPPDGPSQPDTPTDNTPRSQAARAADALREKAQKFQATAESNRRDRRENTPKQRKQAAVARFNASNAEHAARAALALAAAWESDSVPDILRDVRSAKEIGEMMTKRRDYAREGYYDCIPTDEYNDETPKARALQALADSSEAPAETAEDMCMRTERAAVLDAGIQGFHPTPPDIVAQMIELADIHEGAEVLEPSAGRGDIATACRAAGARVSCVEQSHRLANILEHDGHNVVRADFLELEPRAGQYDAVLMNPPFESRADAAHVMHAFKFLKPRGVLVAIVSPGLFFANTKLCERFRRWFDDNNGERIRDIEPGTFENCGAGVILIRLYAPQD